MRKWSCQTNVSYSPESPDTGFRPRPALSDRTTGAVSFLLSRTTYDPDRLVSTVRPEPKNAEAVCAKVCTRAGDGSRSVRKTGEARNGGHGGPRLRSQLNPGSGKTPIQPGRSWRKPRESANPIRCQPCRRMQQDNCELSDCIAPEFFAFTSLFAAQALKPLIKPLSSLSGFPPKGYR